MRRMVVALALALVACGGEELEPMDAYESAELQARAYNFQIFPGARFLEEQTEALRRAHFVLQPDAIEAPPMAMYEADAPLEEVARFYAGKYRYGTVAENDVNDFSSVRPPAYYTAGDLAADAAGIRPIVQKLGFDLTLARYQGPWRGAHIAARESLPRVTLQRPYIDVVNDRVVDKTLILLVRE
ncbi:MAG: hypothetical protein ACRD2J_10580 [Thermoanaerobaculia bacterium]